MKNFWNKLKKAAVVADKVENKAVEIGVPVPTTVQTGFKAAELLVSMFKKKDK